MSETVGPELPFRRIGQTEHKQLYHYEKFKAEYLSALLRDQRIHCSNVDALNDPWDCQPWFDEDSLEDPEKLEKYFRFMRSKFPGAIDENLVGPYEDRVRKLKYERVNLMGSASEENIRTIRKRRIYCMTPDPTSTLMWSHYAENHKGICLEFGIDNPLMANAIEVIYEDDYPVWMPYDFEEEHDRSITMILTKAKPWEYEEEFRLISLFYNGRPTPLQVVDGCFLLPPGTLKSVIAGCESDHEAIAAIVKAHTPELPVKRAIRVPHKFKLQIIEVE